MKSTEINQEKNNKRNFESAEIDLMTFFPPNEFQNKFIVHSNSVAIFLNENIVGVLCGE